MPRPPNRVSFPMDHRHRLYLCASCRTHFLDAPTNGRIFTRDYRNLITRMRGTSPDGEMMNGVVCNPAAPVNVRFDTMVNRTVRYGMPAVRVFCDECNVIVGNFFIMRHIIISRPGALTSIRRGLVMLDPDCLIYWDGRMRVWADNDEPADESDDE